MKTLKTPIGYDGKNYLAHSRPFMGRMANLSHHSTRPIGLATYARPSNTRTIIYTLAICLCFLSLSPLKAQTNLPPNQTVTVNTLTSEDYIIPEGIEKLSIEVRGADGGNARLSGGTCNVRVRGGQGATMKVTFAVGPAGTIAKLEHGGILRVFAGRAGQNDDSGCAPVPVGRYGAGGGSSAILYQSPSQTDAEWELLAVAGGGGGGGRQAADIFKIGFGGNIGINGDSNAVGNGGQSGNCGESKNIFPNVTGYGGGGIKCERNGAAGGTMALNGEIFPTGPSLSTSRIFLLLKPINEASETGGKIGIQPIGGDGFTGGAAGAGGGGGGGGFSGGAGASGWPGGGGGSYITPAFKPTNITRQSGLDGESSNHPTHGSVIITARLACPSGDILLSNQQDVDDYTSFYPNCTTLPGEFKLDGSDITDISSLPYITSIGGDLIIRGTSITDLGSFAQLTTVGGLEIIQNDLLNNLDDFNNLISIENNFRVSANPSLTSIGNLFNLNFVGGDIVIFANGQLVDFSGLCPLFKEGTLVGSYDIRSNAGNFVLEDCICPIYPNVALNSQQEVNDFATNYPECSDIINNLIISGSDINDLTPLSNIANIPGNLSIENCQILTSLDGLSNLLLVGGDISIQNNPSLVDFEGLCPLFNGGTFNGTINQSGNGVVLTIEDCYCPSGDVVLASQQEVNDFAINYPSCIDFSGNLTIKGANISDLSPLSNLISIQGTLRIEENNILTDLGGLNNLTYVGNRLDIVKNPRLLNIDELSSLREVENGISILRNNNLRYVLGPPSFEKNNGEITISANPQLQRIEGFPNLYQLKIGLRVIDNSSLVSIKGFPLVSSFDDYLSINNNPLLTEIDAFDRLVNVSNFGIEIINNNVFVNLNGFSSLTNASQLTIDNNPQLTNIDAFCPLFNGNFDPSDFIQSGNGAIFNPEDCYCPSGDITLTSQQEVNDFLTRYPNCTNLEGSLTVSGTDITNLAPLNILQSIGGDLTIENNPNLQHINSFSGITSLNGTLSVIGNNSLLDLNGFTNLSSVKNLLILDNDALININALSNVTSISDYLSISRNPALTNLTCFSGISTLGKGLRITDNPAVENIDLSSLMTVGEDIAFGGNDQITHMNAFSNLRTVGRILSIYMNPSLTSLDGLSNLTSIGFYLAIENNPLLTNFDGLCPLFNAGFSENDYYPNNNGGTFDPEVDCLCPNDNISPEIVCIENTSREIPSSTLSYIVQGGELDASATDDCELEGITNNINNTSSLAGEQFELGTHEIIWTAVDIKGNSISCTTNVVIEYPVGDYFVTTWQTINPNESITIPTFRNGYNYAVDWGDGAVETGITGDAIHTYANPGIHTVRIVGTFPQIFFLGSTLGNREKILSIEQWGNIEWQAMEGAFSGCSNLRITNPNIDTPNLSEVANMINMFAGASSFNGKIGNWDVGNVKNMDGLFAWCEQFNQDLKNWDVSNAITMRGMFRNAYEFNQDIGDWNVGKVTEMTGMFQGASSFDQNLSTWNVENVTEMDRMFMDISLSTDNYDALLIEWSSQNLQTGVTFDAGGSQYCLGEEARRKLVSDFEWTIIDDGADEMCLPTALCQDISVNLGNDGMATITPEQIDMGSSSPIGEVDLSLDISTFTCNELGDNTVILTVTDMNGKSSNCTATVTVEVNEPLIPTATVGEDQVVCDAMSLPLGGNDPIGGVGVWSGPDGVSFLPDANDPNAIAQGLPTGASSLTWTISGGICQNTSNSASIQIISTEITTIVAGAQTTCDPWTNTYSQTLEISHAGAPTTGQLSVNGQLFPIEASPQTVVLTNLSADGQSIDIEAYFTDRVACTFEEVGLFTAPSDCSVPCDIISVVAGDPYNCNPNTDSYHRDLTVEYQGTNLTGNFMVSVNGGATISYPILDQSPQVLTLDALPSNGAYADIEIYISEESNCSWVANNLFQNPQNCGDNPTGDCDISDLTVAEQRCNYEDETYDQDLIITYTDAPTGGTILLKVNGQEDWESFPITGSPQVLTLAGRTPGEGNVDIFVKFSDDNGCTFSANDLFSAPEACVLPCAITSIATGAQTACDPTTNTYSQELIIIYENEPTNGNLIIGGQVFGITGSPQMITLTNLPSDGNEVNITAYFTGDSDCQLTANNLFIAPEACTQPPSADGMVLFVVKDANNMHSGDAAVKNQLENTGYTVEVKSENIAQSSDATSKALVLISNTVSSGAVNTKFTNVEVPVVCYESLLFDELGMTGGGNGSDYGQDSNEQTMDIDNPSHSMAAGLNGEPQVYNSDGTIVWGNPNNNAIKVASTQGWYSGQWSVFGYEAGSTMVSGTAPARRASLFFKASQVSKLNNNGWALFDAVICWATGCQTARFAPEVSQVPPVKAYPNPFLSNLTIEWNHHAQEVQLIMRNLLGQEVLFRKVMLQGRYQLSTGNLPEGMYILQLIGDDFKQEVKVVKE